MYQVLARKYRPRNFIELVGQNHVSRALTSALERGRLHHAYLFTGTRGVGKTTIARILAKCLNCETGVTSTPCEVCATCTAVNEGRFIDLIEIDAASRTKVEDTRELLDNVPYAPTQGRFKVYLIDEVHMLSTHSFNALLKTLEEPPEHVKFLFATTDPQKLPITVISRCLQFTLRPLAVDEITTHLTDILHKEQISAEQDAIWQIAESAQGSLRDALSLTDQAIAYGQGAIKHQDVKEMLGLIDRTIIFDLILAIHQNQQQHVSQLLMQFRQQALDVSLVLDQFISTLHELALLQYLPDLSLKYSSEINAKIMQLSRLISAQDLQLYYQVACKGRADLQLAVTQEQGFEMTVLRLLAFRPLHIHEVTVSSVDASPFSSQTQVSSQTQNQSAPLVQVTAEPIELEQHMNAGMEQQNAKLDQQTQHISFADPAFDDDVEDELATANQNLQHEPNSDDYLDDKNEESHASFDTVSMASEHEQRSDTVIEQGSIQKGSIQQDHIEPDNLIERTNVVKSSLLMDADVQHTQVESDVALQSVDKKSLDHVDSIEPSLSLFGEAPLGQVKLQSTAETQDIFFLDPKQDESDALELPPKIEESIEQNLEQDLTVTNPAQSTNVHSDLNIAPASEQLLPQDILKLAPQVMQGDWTIDKWEFWFRQSDLSPALQELAQQGLMTGQIDGACIFSIPQKYETLLTQFQMTLENELKNQWPNTRFSVQYQEITAMTPYDQQVLRKERAYDRAAELLKNEDAVKGLIHSFDADLHNIQLKS